MGQNNHSLAYEELLEETLPQIEEDYSPELNLVILKKPSNLLFSIRGSITVSF